MSANIENYYKLEVLFSVHERLKSENAKPILHKITRFIFNPNSPESEANSLSEIQDDIIIFSTLLEGYVHSILKNKIKPDSYDTYLKEHNFFIWNERKAVFNTNWWWYF